MFSDIDDQISQTNGQPVSHTHQLVRALSVVGVTTSFFGSLLPRDSVSRVG
jgi:hypothetical protein